MAEIPNSAILAELLKRAEIQEATNYEPANVERFLVAVIDAIDGNESREIELIGAQAVLDAYAVNPEQAKKQLTEYETTHNRNLISCAYLRRKVMEGKLRIRQEGGTQLTVGDLLVCIFDEPRHAVKKILAIHLSGGSPVAEASRLTDIEFPEDKELEDDFDMEDFCATVKKRAREVDTGMNEEDFSLKRGQRAAPEPSQVMRSEMAALVADTNRIRQELQSNVFGQSNAINTFVKGYYQANHIDMTEPSRKRPKATFLFAGPPGVGKTFLAENIAKAVDLPFQRFDMSEYADKEANLEFCGSDKVYQNGKRGNVTGYVEDHPKCVLLFDEIEKAHIKVIYLFLQMLDAGRLRDNYEDHEVSFKDTIIILTTNAGRQLYEETDDLSSVSRKVIIRALQKDIDPQTKEPVFPQAICSRFASGNVVMMNHISADNLRSIAKKEITKHASNLKKTANIEMQIEDSVYTAILFAEGSNADARTVRGRAESFFNSELYELLRLLSSEKVKTDISDLTSINITVDLSRSSEEISVLFHATEATRVLVFADPKTIKLCKKKMPSCQIIGVQTYEAALEATKENEIGLMLLDMCCGMSADTVSGMNLEDVDSEARTYFKFVREQCKDIPLYMIEHPDYLISEEEKTSFTDQGVRGFLQVNPKNKLLAQQMEFIVTAQYQQANLKKLARENKLISFETSQTLSKDGKHAEIKLYDFNMKVAIDAEDAKNILNAASKPDVTFDDVIGAKEAKKELEYFIQYLRNPKKYMGTGVKAPKGVLLYGAPGTGKTMLAKAMAAEAGVTFLAGEGNQFLKGFVGEGSQEVHALFQKARKYAPAILFIDEIDAIAKERRGHRGSSGSEETLTAFLTEMDGFVSDPTKPVFVLAATNFDVTPGGDKSLDPALMRRFDRRVYIDLPDKQDRIKFIQRKMEKNPALQISAEMLENIGMRSTGMSPAELDSIIELALRSAIRAESTVVTDTILEEAFEEFIGGAAKKWDASQLERVARHEAGHALVCYLTGETPSYLTIVARGNHGGYMQHAEQEGKATYTREELLARITTSLGGRAAEIVYYGEQNGISTGASGDLHSATNLAQKLICNYGMDEEFGLAVIPEQFLYQSPLFTEVRNGINKILKQQMSEAIRLISEHKDKIDALVNCLLDKNHLSGAEIEQILSAN